MTRGCSASPLIAEWKSAQKSPALPGVVWAKIYTEWDLHGRASVGSPLTLSRRAQSQQQNLKVTSGCLEAEVGMVFRFPKRVSFEYLHGPASAQQ